MGTPRVIDREWAALGTWLAGLNGLAAIFSSIIILGLFWGFIKIFKVKLNNGKKRMHLIAYAFFDFVDLMPRRAGAPCDRPLWEPLILTDKRFLVIIVAAGYEKGASNVQYNRKNAMEQLRGEQFERVVREKGKLSTDINALLYALIIANPEVLEEEAVKMGASLEVVLDRLGYIDKRMLEKSENERAKAEEEKSRLLEEHARFMKSQREAAIDMLRHGMPVTSICKWTELSEDEIRSLKPPVIEKLEETSK